MSATEEETLVISETITETTKFINADEINVASLMGKRNYNSLEQEAEDEDEDDKPRASKIQRKETCYAAYRRIQKPVTNSNKITAEKGLVHDYKQELQYVLSTFFDENSALNLRTLSLVQLLKKSTVAEFRDFLRKQPHFMNRLFVVLAELTPNSPVISISAACFLYFMARDRKGLHISENCIRLISILLKQDPQNTATKSDKEYAKHLNVIWNTMQDWLRYWQSKKSDKSINFDFARESLSSTSLTLEALAYIALKEQSKLFKAELLNSGCLTSIVAKLDKVILELVHSVSSKETVGSRLKTVELCYRILENAAAYDPKNQNFLIQHRNSLLIFSSAKFLNFCLKFINETQYGRNGGGGGGKKQQQQKQNDCNRVYENISLLCRVLMNVSHDNENASLKIGQIPQFLGNCLLVLAQHSRYAPKEKFFDIAVMMYGMLVNLLERCAANRRKFIQLKADYLLENGEFVKDIAALELLTKLFARHDAAAKLIDEELDNDLAAEEPGDLGDGNGNERMSMSQDEVLAAIQSMMSKASIHMEDSMIASYCTLVVAILVGTDHNLAEQVRNFLPDKDLTPMLEQLERFMDFMRITNMKERTVNNIERILNSFRIASNSAD